MLDHRTLDGWRDGHARRRRLPAWRRGARGDRAPPARRFAWAVWRLCGRDRRDRGQRAVPAGRAASGAHACRSSRGRWRSATSPPACPAAPPRRAPRPRLLRIKVERPGGVARTRAQIVSDIQRELSRRGFFDEPVDGVYGPKTDAAIRDFEQAAGLKGNSQPDDALLRLITRSSTHARARACGGVGTTRTDAAPARAVPAHAYAIRRRACAYARHRARRARGSAGAARRCGVPTSASADVPRPPAPIRTAANPAAPAKRVLSVQRALADFGYGQVAPTGVLGAETKSAIERFERERKLPVTGPDLGSPGPRARRRDGPPAGVIVSSSLRVVPSVRTASESGMRSAHSDRTRIGCADWAQLA